MGIRNAHIYIYEQRARDMGWFREGGRMFGTQTN